MRHNETGPSGGLGRKGRPRMMCSHNHGDILALPFAHSQCLDCGMGSLRHSSRGLTVSLFYT